MLACCIVERTRRSEGSGGHTVTQQCSKPRASRHQHVVMMAMGLYDPSRPGTNLGRYGCPFLRGI